MPESIPSCSAARTTRCCVHSSSAWSGRRSRSSTPPSPRRSRSRTCSTHFMLAPRCGGGRESIATTGDVTAFTQRGRVRIFGAAPAVGGGNRGRRPAVGAAAARLGRVTRNWAGSGSGSSSEVCSPWARRWPSASSCAGPAPGCSIGTAVRGIARRRLGDARCDAQRPRAAVRTAVLPRGAASHRAAVETEVGSPLPEALETPLVVDRTEWVDLNIATFRQLFGRVETIIQAATGRPRHAGTRSRAHREPADRERAARVPARLPGRKVLGQYDVSLLAAAPDVARPPRIRRAEHHRNGCCAADPARRVPAPSSRFTRPRTPSSSRHTRGCATTSRRSVAEAVELLAADSRRPRRADAPRDLAAGTGPLAGADHDRDRSARPSSAPRRSCRCSRATRTTS